LGVIEALQTEQSRTVRNDRLIARTSLSINYQEAETLADLGEAFIDHLGRFFTNYNQLKGRNFEVIGVGDSVRALELLKSLREEVGRSGSV
jgi:inorganic pyrophosphatase